MDFVYVVQAVPFTFPGPSDGTTPNRKRSYVGFIPDLIAALSKRLRFNYELYAVGDSKYGHFDNVTNRWTGMIGEVMRRDV